MSRASRLIAWIASLLLIVVALFVGLREGQAFLIHGASPEARATAFSGDAETVSPLLSGFARRALLEACLQTLEEMTGSSTVSDEQTSAVSGRCLSIAETIAADAPLSPNEWFVAASLAGREGDRERLQHNLRLSFETGPAEQWIAERRAIFAYEVSAWLSPELRSMADQDLALLLRTNAGIHALAGQYVDDPAMRGHLVDIAVTLDPAVQARFLGLVKDVAAKKIGKPSP